MTGNYFRVLAYCVATSVGLLSITTYVGLPPWVTMLGGIAPLMYYHLIFLRPLAPKGLSQSAIDSVYYFGFLVTIAALGISAISIAMHGPGGNMATVIYQFGAGLFATGYAVVARMHLTSAASAIEEASPEALMDRYVQRSVEMVTNVEMATAQLTELSKTLINQTAEVTELTRTTAEKMMMDVARAFESEMKSTLETARNSLTEIRGLVADTSFVTEREQLAKSMKASIEAATQLNLALSELAAKSRMSALATEETVGASKGLQNTLQSLNSQLGKFADEDGVLTQAIGLLASAAENAAQCNDGLAAAVTGLGDVAETVAGTGPTFKQMRTLTKKATEQLEALADVSEKLDGALDQITNAAMAADSLADGLGKVDAAVRPLSESSEALVTRFDLINTSSEQLQRNMATLPEQAVLLQQTAQEMSSSMKQVFSAIEHALEHASKLGEHTASSAQAVEGANKLLSSAAQLQAFIEPLGAQFSGFAASLHAAQQAVDDSSSGIKAVVHSSASLLEADVKRSIEATSLLTERLTQVAQTIIDRTRQPEPVG